MKCFKNKQTEIVRSSENPEDKISYAELLVSVLKVPVQGMDIKMMSSRIKLIDKIESVPVGELIKVDDSEMELLVSLVDAPGAWVMVHRDIVSLSEDLANATEE